MKILVVEDEPIIAADIQDRLLDMGFEVCEVFSSGEEALTFLKTQDSIDIVLMDIQLEGKLDGIETASHILKIKNIPIIFLTSNSDDATFERAKATHPAAFLSKPFRGRDLKHAIELAILNIPHRIQSNETNTEELNTFFLNDRVFIKSKDGMTRLLFQDILWIEADDYYSKIVTAEKTYLLSQTLGKVSKIVENSPTFIRVHRSFIVNFHHVEQIGDITLTIHKTQIPIGKSFKEGFMQHINKI